MIVVAIIAILAAIAIPQYRTYIARTQVTRVMDEAGQLKTVVEDCINNGKTTMADDSKAPGDQCATIATSSDLLDPSKIQGGIAGVPIIMLPTNPTSKATITATFGNHASIALSHKTLTWIREADGSWKCAATTPAAYTPAGCAGLD
jgi:type IV pilus assembly protein PilA